MEISLGSETKRFVEEMVREGRFASADALIEAALTEFKAAGDLLDDDAVQAINDAESQADRGEGLELDAFREHISRRFRDE